MKFLSQTNPSEFTGKRVIVRVDFNVPVKDGVVSKNEAFKIESALPTIEFLKNAGAKIILISHLGNEGNSLQPIAEYIIKNHPDLNLTFTKDISGVLTNCVLLENLRINPGEKSNDLNFAKELASLADFYVNDAFAESHRAYMSIVGIPQLLPSFAGLLMEQEVEHLGQALHPTSPSVLVMAGVKFETKLPLIEKFLPLYDAIILGGGLFNTYLEKSGVSVGDSVIDETADLKNIIGNEKIIIPDHVIVERDGESSTIAINEVGEHDVIVDIVLSNEMRGKITIAKMVVWNGPSGWYEKGYVKSSQELLELCDPSRQNVIVGGGDTVTLVRELKLEPKVSFLSTGGGAMLEYLQNGTLPGIEALK